MTPAERAHLRVVVTELATALRILTDLATRMRRTVTVVNDEMVGLDAALYRAARAMRHLRPKRRSRIGGRNG